MTFMHQAKHWQTGEVIKTYNMTVHDDTLQEVVEDFEMFLKGCGFVFPEGARLDFVYPEDDYHQVNVDLNSGAGLDIDFGGAGNVWAQAHYNNDIDLKETK
jgi:hypothetical protein